MIKINASSINDLLYLHQSGAPVTLTSHPGNASLYKLTLWRCGIPEHLWDVTCCKTDANNWPMYMLKGGQALPLVSEEFLGKVERETSAEKRYVTAYQRTKAGERLGRVHVKAMTALFPEVISSCSRLLLQEEERLRDMFLFLAETRFFQVFGRHITPEGVMRPCHVKVSPQAAADSFIGLLKELEHLLFSDDDIETKGGLCYDGIMPQLSAILVQFWQTGRIDRYDISGPDMIHYASRPEYQRSMADMLEHLHKWNDKLVPKSLVMRMFPGTTARVGYLKGHVSEEVLRRKRRVLETGAGMSGDYKRRLWAEAKEDEKLWPIGIKPSVQPYFSQYDLLDSGSMLEVDEYWQEIPLEKMWDTLVRANSLLRLK